MSHFLGFYYYDGPVIQFHHSFQRKQYQTHSRSISQQIYNYSISSSPHKKLPTFYLAKLTVSFGRQFTIILGSVFSSSPFALHSYSGQLLPAPTITYQVIIDESPNLLLLLY